MGTHSNPANTLPIQLPGKVLEDGPSICDAHMEDLDTAPVS